MAQRYKILREWTELDLPGITINAIYHAEVEDTHTGETAEGSGWSRDEAVGDAIIKIQD